MQPQAKTYLLLHLLLMLYSASSICSKYASGFPVFSLEFCALYAGMIALLAIYAIGWQQMLKHLPLTTAFSNKAATVVWGIIWGLLLFQEPLSLGKIAGALFIIVGIVLFSRDAGQDVQEQNRE